MSEVIQEILVLGVMRYYHWWNSRKRTIRHFSLFFLTLIIFLKVLYSSRRNVLLRTHRLLNICNSSPHNGYKILLITYWDYAEIDTAQYLPRWKQSHRFLLDPKKCDSFQRAPSISDDVPMECPVWNSDSQPNYGKLSKTGIFLAYFDKILQNPTRFHGNSRLGSVDLGNGFDS